MAADINNSEELQFQIQSLIKDLFRYNKMAQKAERRAQIYSPERFAEEYLNAYKQLISITTEKPQEKHQYESIGE